MSTYTCTGISIQYNLIQLIHTYAFFSRASDVSGLLALDSDNNTSQSTQCTPSQARQNETSAIYVDPFE